MLDPFRVIPGGKEIAEYMGYSRQHCTRFAGEMKECGCLWKHGNKSQSKLETTPYLINRWFVQRQLNIAKKQEQ